MIKYSSFSIFIFYLCSLVFICIHDFKSFRDGTKVFEVFLWLIIRYYTFFLIFTKNSVYYIFVRH